MKSLISSGRSIAYQDAGKGPAVILAHCSSASHREWVGLTEKLKQRYRVFVPDLIGYGKSEPWSDGATLDPAADPDVLLQLADLADGPIHLAGHSYGAAAALEASLRLGSRLQSLTLIEPVAFHLLKTTGHPEWPRVQQLAARVNRAVAAGLKYQAASVYMKYWIGSLRWWAMPRKARQRIADTVGKVAAEFAMIEAMTRIPSEHATIRAPVRLIYGVKTRPAARAVVEVLAAALPHAEVCGIAGAGHMSPITHSETVWDLVQTHVDRGVPANTATRVEVTQV